MLEWDGKDGSHESEESDGSDGLHVRVFMGSKVFFLDRECKKKNNKMVNEIRKICLRKNGMDGLNEVALDRMEREKMEKERYIANAFIYDTSRWALTP